MFLRLLFVLLVMLNIVAGAWLFLGQPYTHVPPATDPGVPELRLLSELPAQAATTAPASDVAAPAPAPVAANANAPAAPLRCLTIGPFATPHDLQQARSALAPVARQMRSRQEQVAQSRSWWVYLPAPGSRAQALALTRQLAAHGISDYFVVGGGDQPNTISLGLFKDQDNARKRRASVAAAGFPAARLTERSETAPQYWLDLVAAGDTDWRNLVHADGVGSHSMSCF